MQHELNKLNILSFSRKISTKSTSNKRPIFWPSLKYLHTLFVARLVPRWGPGDCSRPRKGCEQWHQRQTEPLTKRRLLGPPDSRFPQQRTLSAHSAEERGLLEKVCKTCSQNWCFDAVEAMEYGPVTCKVYHYTCTPNLMVQEPFEWEMICTCVTSYWGGIEEL